MAVGNNNAALTANQAYLIPIGNVMVPFTISRIAFYVASSSGNADVGIYYSDDESTFTRAFSTGSFALAGGLNTKSFSTQALTPVAGRRWYYALAPDNGTATFLSTNPGTTNNFVPFAYLKATSFVLPASITTATAVTTQSVPALHGAT
jgi:hypothetical protein